MTVEINDTVEQYIISGVGPYAFSFRIFGATDLAVSALSTSTPPVPTLLTYLTHYTVSGANDEDGGSITLTASAASTYAGFTLDIRSNTPQEQGTSIRNLGRFLPEIHEAAFDNVARQIQDLQRRVNACVRYPDNTLKDGMMTPLSEWLSRYLTISAEGNLEPAALVSGTISASIIGGFLYPQTPTENAAGKTPVNTIRQPFPEDVRRWDATDEGGVSDSTAEIQLTIDSQDAGTIKGGQIWLPGDANSVYNISDTISFPARASGDNHTRWYSFKGMGRGSPRIVAKTGLEEKPMLNANGQDASTYSFYREFSDFYLNGAGIAQRGIELYYNQHFKVENVFISGLESGSALPTNTGGIRVFGCISSQFRDVKIHNCDSNGIAALDGSGNFFNANLVEGCSFLDVTGDGFYASGGWSGCAHIGNTHEFCDNYGMRLAGYSGTCGLIAGNYFESNGHGDLYIGEETAANAVVVEGNYLNGYTAGVSATDYTPIRLKFADGVILRGNMVATTNKSTTGYLILDANISGGTVQNCCIENNQVRGLAVTTPPNQIYNLPGTWVDFGNRLIDPVFVPLIKNNVIRQRLPFGAWTQTTAVSGTITRGNALYGAASSLDMNRPGAGDTCLISKAITIGEEFKNRFVTFAVPVRSLSTSKQIDVAVVPNGTSPQSTTISISTLANGDVRMIYALVFVPSNATTITISITMVSAGSRFEIGHPCLYVGAEQWYSAEADFTDTGTFTPVIGGATSESGQTYSSQIGRWVRHGNQITCYFDVTLSNKGTITGAVVLKGLPFAGITGQGLPGVTIGFFNALATNWVSLNAYVEPQNSRCFINGLTAAAASLTALAAADIGNTTRLAGSFSYLVDQFP